MTGKWVKKYWFLLGLVAVTLTTLSDPWGAVTGTGIWLKTSYGPEFVIFAIFSISGLFLNISHVRSGLGEIKGFFAALGLIFLVAPAIGCFMGNLGLPYGITVGIFIVSVMPTTLSSGVVMTGASGGNMAHALLITLSANFIAIFTVPISLSFLLSSGDNSSVVIIDKFAIMFKLCLLVLLPLVMGMAIKPLLLPFVRKKCPNIELVSQVLILAMIWMGLSQVKGVILESGISALLVILAVAVFHVILVTAAFFIARVLNLGPGKRESLIFMGGQKTLPLSIIIQVSLFPDVGLALVVCVLHHIIHLMMDGFLVGRFKSGHAGIA